MGCIQTTVIILICVELTTSSLLTFCENDASYCNNPNLYELGSINFGKCNVGYVLHRIEKTTLLKCVKECLKLANCKSINFRNPWQLCDLNGGNDFQYNLVEEGGCMLSEISDWPQVININILLGCNLLFSYEFYLFVSFIQLLDLHLPMQSVHITSNVASSNPAQARCTRHNIM
jgi:hypothetical protein